MPETPKKQWPVQDSETNGTSDSREEKKYFRTLRPQNWAKSKNKLNICWPLRRLFKEIIKQLEQCEDEMFMWELEEFLKVMDNNEAVENLQALRLRSPERQRMFYFL